ncbi:ABC transporter permease [Gluconobacter cerinus]|uniref:ABC transporter permease n=1 Tax=Gluconobacter cerinus TaxID=38307 RepID=UPI001C042CA0|nr:ABC transporter permease [Gluconobacter cerinus]
MLSHIALIFWRGIVQRRLFTTLNVLGMALGMATFLTLVLIVRYEFSFDRWIPHAADIYRLDAFDDSEASVSSIRLIDALRAEHPDWNATAVLRGFSGATIRVNENAWDVFIARTDPHLFDVFALPLLEGDPATALVPDGVVLSQAEALRFFGTDHSILGKTLDLTQKGQTHRLHVTGVLKELPANTTPRFDIIVPSSQAALHINDLWPMATSEIWVRVSPSVASQFPTLLQGLVQRHAAGLSEQDAKKYVVRGRALTSLHFFDATIGMRGTDKRLPVILGIVGLLALGAGLVNFVTLSTALAATRAREVAMRKVLGATVLMLGLSFTAEAIGMALIAAFVALALTELTLPWITTLSGWPVRLDFGFAVPLLIITAVIGGACAGAYPSWVLSRFQPATVLSSARLPGSGRLGSRLREGLTIVQFSFAVTLTICTLVIWRQTHLLQTMDRGFHQSGLLVSHLPNDPTERLRQQRLSDLVRDLPGVTGATVSDDAPGGGSASITFDITRPGNSTPAILAVIGTESSTLPIWGAHLLAGRLFDSSHDYDSRPMPAAPFDSFLMGQTWSFGAHNVVINESAVRALGFADDASAIGTSITLHGKDIQTIIGVIADMRFKDSRASVTPALYYAISGPIVYGVLSVRYRNVSENTMRAAIATIWKRVYPESALNLRSVGDIINEDVRPEQQRGMLMIVASFVTLSISCVGLYGIAVFNVRRRLFEIGVRKVLGATAQQVTRLLILQFLRPVMIANIVAWPVAWWVMRNWLSGFDRRISLSPLYFALTALIVLALAVLTTLFQIRRGARSAPAIALGSS